MVEPSIPFVMLSFITSVSCLGVVGVAVEGSLQSCSFYSLCYKSLEYVKGILKQTCRIQTVIGHANKNFDLLICFFLYWGGDYVLNDFLFIAVCIIYECFIVCWSLTW